MRRTWSAIAVFTVVLVAGCATDDTDRTAEDSDETTDDVLELALRCEEGDLDACVELAEGQDARERNARDAVGDESIAAADEVIAAWEDSGRDTLLGIELALSVDRAEAEEFFARYCPLLRDSFEAASSAAVEDLGMEGDGLTQAELDRLGRESMALGFMSVDAECLPANGG